MCSPFKKLQHHLSKGLDTIRIVRQCQQDSVLSSYCYTRLVTPESLLEVDLPCVLKLPNYHGGFGKWMIHDREELNRVVMEEHSITIGQNVVKTGYLGRFPFLSDLVMVEPVFSGLDHRVWVILDRKTDEYSFRGLIREIKKGEWLANRYTASYSMYNDISSDVREMCLAATKILGHPDVFAVDFMQNIARIEFS